MLWEAKGSGTRSHASTFPHFSVPCQEARTTYRRILQESARKLNMQGSHLGSCIEKARPYYEARRLAKEVWPIVCCLVSRELVPGFLVSVYRRCSVFLVTCQYTSLPSAPVSFFLSTVHSFTFSFPFFFLYTNKVGLLVQN